MFDLSFIGAESLSAVKTTLAADWHRTDDPWGAYLKGPGNPATNASNPQAGTVYVPYGEGGPDVHGANASHTTSLGVGPDFSNNMGAPHNCVGGSEQGCIPKNPPVGDPSKTGMSSTLPPPATWYANGAHTTGLGAGPEFYNNMEAPNNCIGGSETSCPASSTHPPPAPMHWYANGGPEGLKTTALGKGPEFYNNMEAPNNCVGGSETSCPASVTHPPPPPMHWYANGGPEGLKTTSLGVGPDFSNNMGAPHNCVGGSEQGCIPKNPPVYDASKTGMSSTLPPPATWYANGAHTTGLGAGPEFYNNMPAPNNCIGGSETSCPASSTHPPPAPMHWYANGGPEGLKTTALGKGPEFYNNMEAPNNCVGGSETSCPASVTHPPPPPMHWYANGGPEGLKTTSLGVGPDFSNNMGAPHNCVGGSEQGCIPKNPPVYDASKTGMSSTLPAPASWYANSVHTTGLGAGPEFYNNMPAPNNCIGGSETSCPASSTAPPPAPMHWYAAPEAQGMTQSKALATPLAPVEEKQESTVVKAGPAHFLLSAHAFTLAVVQGVIKGDLKDVTKDALANAEAITPVGSHYIRTHVM